MPFGGALGARRQIAVRASAGKAEPHRHHGDTLVGVEIVVRDLQPLTQAITRAVIPGNAGLMDDTSRGLPDDQHAGTAVSQDDGARLVRQRALALAAGTDVVQATRERCLGYVIRHCCHGFTGPCAGRCSP